MPLDIWNPVSVFASKHPREHNQTGIWLHSWLHPNGKCDLVHHKYHRGAHQSPHKLSPFLSHIYEWRMVIYTEKSLLAISETLFPSFFMVFFGFGIYSQGDEDENMGLEQCTDWTQHYVQPAWAAADTNFTHSPQQMEATKLSSASSSPVPSGPWEWSAFHRKTLPQKPSPAELNQSNFFTPEWKYMSSISFISQKKCFTFDTAIESKFSYLLALGCNSVPPWPTLATSSLQALTDPHGEL